MGLGDSSTGRLAFVAAVLLVLGALLIFLIEWLGGLLVIAALIIGFVLLMRFVREEFD
ncbi:MAG: hypothetical protein M3401_05770 [Actinomycetota bacterium]|nr:hypothetical protein [Actinomycetota bacterium]